MPGCGMSVSQHCYIEKILARSKLTNCKSVSTAQVQELFSTSEIWMWSESVCVSSDPDVDYQQIFGIVTIFSPRVQILPTRCEPWEN